VRASDESFDTGHHHKRRRESNTPGREAGAGITRHSLRDQAHSLRHRHRMQRRLESGRLWSNTVHTY